MLRLLETFVQLGVIRQATTSVVNVMDGMVLIQKMKVRDITFSKARKIDFRYVLNVTPRPAKTNFLCL